MTAFRDIERLFSPESVAVVGASRVEGTVGHAILRNLVLGGYTGVIHPVNPKARSIMGLACVPDVTRLPEAPDLVVVIVPAPAVENVVRSAAERGTRHFVVISAGFKEVGPEGAQRELRLKALAQEKGLSILGPNCLGVINTDPKISLDASFGRAMPRRGCLGLISQSGALCAALLDYAAGRGIGFSRFISFGNKADINEVDLLRSLAGDPNTRVILMYVEDLSDARGFIEASETISHSADPKPILCIKTGRTAQGAAAASHTGSLAGSDEVYDALMTQAGVIRIESVQDLFDVAEGFADGILPASRRTAIVTNAGGPGIMATDACIRSGLQLAKFHDYTLKSLKFQLPPTSSLKNPVDVIGDARHDRYRSALDAVCADENVDQVMVLVTPQNMTDVTEIASVVGEARQMAGKPITACLMGLVDVSPGVEILQKKFGVPVYAFPENAMRAMAAKCRFAEWVKTPLSPVKRLDADGPQVCQIMEQELAAGRKNLVEAPALELLRFAGFPTVDFARAATAQEAVAAAEKMGFPVVMKISGPTLLHKTDIGGVRLNLTDGPSVARAFDEMIATVRSKAGPDVEIWGVLIQKMLAKGKEVILGVTRDPSFGPLVMFGLGGIYTEALRDVAFRLAPMRENVAGEMIRSIRAYRLLEGVRGEAPSDLAAVAELILRLSQLVTDHPQIKELDINPLLVYPAGQGARVADARIILDTPAS